MLSGGEMVNSTPTTPNTDARQGVLDANFAVFLHHTANGIPTADFGSDVDLAALKVHCVHSGSFTWAAPGTVTIPAGQWLPNDPIPETYTNNALTYDFIQLLMSGTPMPPSVYPTFARGELVPNTAADEGFPNIPGLPYEGDQAWPPFVYDFGHRENYDQESGVPTIQPPIIKSVLPVYATKVNEDGNEDVTGLPTVLGEAPLGTYVGWNLATTGWYGPNASNGPGSVGQVFAGAGNSGGYWPFWDTMANRLAAGDPRPSLEGRYGTHDGYVCVVTRAVNVAVQQRFLLPSEAPTLIANAAAGDLSVIVEKPELYSVGDLIEISNDLSDLATGPYEDTATHKKHERGELRKISSISLPDRRISWQDAGSPEPQFHAGLARAPFTVRAARRVGRQRGTRTLAVGRTCVEASCEN